MMWCTLLFRMNCQKNSSLVNLVPLSVTTCSGSPNVAKTLLIFSLVTSDVDDFVLCTSIYLECSSMRRRNMCLKKGPVQSAYTLLLVALAIPTDEVVLLVGSLQGHHSGQSTTHTVLQVTSSWQCLDGLCVVHPPLCQAIWRHNHSASL